MDLNWLAISVITFAAFAGGAVWHGPLFGNLWGKIHGMDCVDEKVKKEMMKGMWKLLVTEFIATFLIVTSLACLIRAIPQYSGIQTAFMAWIGFMVPITVSNIIWGGDKREWWLTKIVIAVSYRLIVFIFAGYVLSVWL